MADKHDLKSRQLFIAFEEDFTDVDVRISTVKRARQHLRWNTQRKTGTITLSQIWTKRSVWGLVFRTLEDAWHWLGWCNLNRWMFLFGWKPTVRLHTTNKESLPGWRVDQSIRPRSMWGQEHQQEEPSRMASWPKHPAKVHVRAGTSARGATTAVILAGILTFKRY